MTFWNSSAEPMARPPETTILAPESSNMRRTLGASALKDGALATGTATLDATGFHLTYADPRLCRLERTGEEQVTTTTATTTEPAKPVKTARVEKPRRKQYWTERRIIGELHRHGIYW